MDISAKLADLNWQVQIGKRFYSWKCASCHLCFWWRSGVDAYSIPIEKLEKLQDSLRILSGLYGLKPLDLIQAYRLEMGTSCLLKNKKFIWVLEKKVTNALNKELEKTSCQSGKQWIFLSVDTRVKVAVVTPDFKDKDGKLKIISFYAKKARGMMVRYIIDTDAKR
jgi:cytoplasmic iron level regulating protein YaaA (DUF328/UPF0246 family)